MYAGSIFSMLPFQCYKLSHSTSVKPSEISELHLQSLQLSWDSYPYQDAQFEDLNEEKISRFIKKVNNGGRFLLPANPYKAMLLLKLIPIEIKSGSTGSLKSLHQFIEAADHPYAIRMHAGALKVEKAVTPNKKSYLLLNLPYYAGTVLPQYIKWFVQQKI